jgi:hypothetical protein
MVGSLKMNTALEYSTRVAQEGCRRCKKSTLNDLVHLTPLRIPLMNPPGDRRCKKSTLNDLAYLTPLRIPLMNPVKHSHTLLYIEKYILEYFFSKILSLCFLKG